MTQQTRVPADLWLLHMWTCIFITAQSRQASSKSHIQTHLWTKSVVIHTECFFINYSKARLAISCYGVSGLDPHRLLQETTEKPSAVLGVSSFYFSPDFVCITGALRWYSHPSTWKWMEIQTFQGNNKHVFHLFDLIVPVLIARRPDCWSAELHWEACNVQTTESWGEKLNIYFLPLPLCRGAVLWFLSAMLFISSMSPRL